jgi:hypothetical protein
LPPKNAGPCLSLDLSKKPPSVKVSTGGTVEYSGAGLDGVTSVTMDGTELVFLSYAAGTSISAVINGPSIPAAGKKELIFKTTAGKTLKAPLLVVSPA